MRITVGLTTLIVSMLISGSPGSGQTFSPAEIQAESAKANAFFERTFDDYVSRHPETATDLGLKKDNDKWDDDSSSAEAEDLARTLLFLAELKRSVRYEALDEQTKLSYQLWVRQTEQAAEAFRWRFYSYPVNQMFGAQSLLPAFLIAKHRIDDLSDAQAYIARLRGVRGKLDQLITGLEERRERGIVPPKFVFPLVLESCRNLITGVPFEASDKSNPLWEDFQAKVERLSTLTPDNKRQLFEEAKIALSTSVKPAYAALIAELESLEKIATDDDGVWKFPSGDAFYRYRLRRETTTDLSPEEIHDLGLREVARIHQEMEAIRQRVGFKGDLQAFFKFLRDDPQFYYPDTEAGKAAFLQESTRVIDTMRTRLDELFLTKPKAAIEVKAVEAFREKESGGAFYETPAMDASRPGRFYVNLYDMRAQPKYEVEALAYHEGIPGHHMQLSIAQELTGLPRFRRYSFGVTAYIEGWGLYCERIPKEMGFYSDPYSDFGRLSMELLRASRLVVDTGLHAKRWTRAQAVDWLSKMTPGSERDILTSVNRYIVMPGQATAYKIGMLKFLELRERATRELKMKFDLREFHDVLLRNGALPLDLVEEQVNTWIVEKKRLQSSQG